MAAMTIYSSLCACLNGQLLGQECALEISHKVNEPIRIKVTSLLPFGPSTEEGLAQVDDVVRIDVHKFFGHKPGDRVYGFTGRVTAKGASQAAGDGEPAEVWFEVSDLGAPAPLDTEDP